MDQSHNSPLLTYSDKSNEELADALTGMLATAAQLKRDGDIEIADSLWDGQIVPLLTECATRLRVTKSAPRLYVDLRAVPGSVYFRDCHGAFYHLRQCQFPIDVLDAAHYPNSFGRAVNESDAQQLISDIFYKTPPGTVIAISDRVLDL